MSVATVTNIRYDNPRPHLQTLPLIAAARKGEPPRLTRSARQNQVQHLLRHPSFLISALLFSSPFLTSWKWWAMSPPGLRPWTSGTVRRLRDNSPTTVGPGEQINTTPLLWIVPPVPFRASVSACSHRLSNLHYDSPISSHSFSYNTDSRLLKEI